MTCVCDISSHANGHTFVLSTFLSRSQSYELFILQPASHITNTPVVNKPNNVGLKRTSHAVKFSRSVVEVITVTATVVVVVVVMLNYVPFLVVVIDILITIVFSCCKSFGKGK